MNNLDSILTLRKALVEAESADNVQVGREYLTVKGGQDGLTLCDDDPGHQKRTPTVED